MLNLKFVSRSFHWKVVKNLKRSKQEDRGISDTQKALRECGVVSEFVTRNLVQNL